MTRTAKTALQKKDQAHQIALSWIYFMRTDRRNPSMVEFCLVYQNANEDDIKITKEETEALKAELRTVGGANFMKKYVCNDSRYSVNELLYAFGYVLVLLSLTLWS